MISLDSDFAEAFAALGHPTRLKIVDFLRAHGQGGEPVGLIQRAVGVPASTLSHHLEVLRRAGVLKATRQERFIYYALNFTRFNELAAFFEGED